MNSSTYFRVSFNSTELDAQQLQSLVISLGIGGFIGLITGVVFKHTAKRVLLTLGTAFIAIQTLQFCGFIDVRWDRITESALPVFDANRDGVLDEKDARYMIQNMVELAPEILAQGLPNLTGFVSGLLIAFWIF
eukprot:g8893.t1